MNNKKISILNLLKVLIGISIVLLSLHIVVYYININKLTGSDDSAANLFGAFGAWLLPYACAALLLQVVILAAAFANKRKNRVIKIIMILFESVYFIVSEVIVNVVIYINLANSNKFLLYGNVILFTLINILIIVYMIKYVKDNENNGQR